MMIGMNEGGYIVAMVILFTILIVLILFVLYGIYDVIKDVIKNIKSYHKERLIRKQEELNDKLLRLTYKMLIEEEQRKREQEKIQKEVQEQNPVRLCVPESSKRQDAIKKEEIKVINRRDIISIDREIVSQSSQKVKVYVGRYDDLLQDWSVAYNILYGEVSDEEELAARIDEFKYRVIDGENKGWTITCNGVRVYSMYYYYPKDLVLSEMNDKIRRHIWIFKSGDSPNNYRYQSILDGFVVDLKRCLVAIYGNGVRRLTLFCIPSSTRERYEYRCRFFSQYFCDNISMENGYNHLRYIKDGISKNKNGGVGVFCEVELDRNFWRGKYVLMFDDVITHGESMDRYQAMLEECGAIVVGGITLGKTLHRECLVNPINYMLGDRK